MKAMQVHNSAEGPALRPAHIPNQRPQKRRLLIRVEAAGVTPD